MQVAPVVGIDVQPIRPGKELGPQGGFHGFDRRNRIAKAGRGIAPVTGRRTGITVGMVL